MTIKEMKTFLLSKKGLTPEERKEINQANDKDIKDLFAEFKKRGKTPKNKERFTDVWF